MTSSIDQEWMAFFSKNAITKSATTPEVLEESRVDTAPLVATQPGLVVSKCLKDVRAPDMRDTPSPEYALSISTKTKILFLNKEIDINRVFWEIPVIEYWMATSGIVKKQMKIMSKTPEELNSYYEKLAASVFFTENVLKQINNPAARSIKFMDERNITIGISYKDIMNSNKKTKNAFYNCFAMVARIFIDGKFKELHVKVFNTGKIEIPGVVSPSIFAMVKDLVLSILGPIIQKKMDTDATAPRSVDLPAYAHVASCDPALDRPDASALVRTLKTAPETKALCKLVGAVGDKQLIFLENKDDQNILVNSNFNCGFCINRDVLYEILKSDKYQLEAAYDPCSYPGVKCRFYFNAELGFDVKTQNGRVMKSDRGMKMFELDAATAKYTEVSVMLFRTGSGLIAGNCTDDILMFIFNFTKNMLAAEKHNIYTGGAVSAKKNVSSKIRKKTLFMNSAVFVDTYHSQTAIP
jgi:hypothetical protein